MPLPASSTDTVWPPKNIANLLPALGRWGAWWANDISMLQRAYGGGLADPTGFSSSDQGGVKVHSLGPIRWFIGTPTHGQALNSKLPVPIAAEICQASADLLFSDPVTVTVDEDATQARIEELLDDEFNTAIAEAAEMGAALGGTYLRVTWDDTVNADGPFTTIKDADEAIPEFKFGRLTAVTFWRVVHRNGKRVWRHLERHETSPISGNGIILHGLYEGEDDTLGGRVSLTVIAETAPLAAQVDLGLEGTIDTGSKGLAVTYVPNQTPNRMWRHDPIGKHLGRSDLDGVEHLMDQLAETMSDWMRARRVARARIMLSKELLKTQGPGKAAIADVDQEVFTTVNTLGGKDLTLEQQIQLIQPKFDPTGYKATADTLIEQILQMSGYSLSTFGVTDEGGDKTATEIEARERRSLMTRARKIRAWQPALVAHITKLLEVDRVMFGNANVTKGLAIEFSDGVQESQLRLAQTVQALYTSESASVEERVSIMHPDWDEVQIKDEVARIKSEFGQEALADPQVDPFDAEEPDGDEPGPVR